MNTALLLIDPQNDFCHPQGSLYVDGAEKDALRLQQFILNRLPEIDGVFITQDTHQPYHIAHPLFWQDAQGRTPEPFTLVSLADVHSGSLKTARPEDATWALHYVKALADGGRYQLCIWPEHCLIGSWGHGVYLPIFQAAHQWIHAQAGRTVQWIAKGANPKTEHYSAFRAEVPDPEDTTGCLNRTLIAQLDVYERIFVSGQALSHCVAASLRDLMSHIRPDKITLLIDTTGAVQGFESLAEIFVQEARARGVCIAKTTEFQAA